MRKTILLLFLLLLLPFGPAQAENTALLIGCDVFAEAQSTAPASRDNVARLAQVLTDYHVITCCDDLPVSSRGLRSVIADSFADCSDEDTLLLYFSTHGVKTDDGIRLMLSDGETDYGISSPELNRILSGLPGEKILILDACYSGSFIARGSGACETSSPIGSATVFTSAGAEEQSWFYYDERPEGVTGGGYYTSAIAEGLDPASGLEADENRDGSVTASELQRYLTSHYAAATSWLYPSDSETVISHSDSIEVTSPITGVQCESNVLTGDSHTSVYSFTARGDARLSWALVYYQENAWQFAGAQILPDRVESPDGSVSPGYKNRSVTLDGLGEEDSGFVMMMMLSHEKDRVRVCGSTTVTALKTQSEIGLSVKASPVFCPASGEEAAIAVSATEPCLLTVTVQNKRNETVAYLAYRQPVRPGGSYFYWTDEEAEPGKYRVCVTASLPESEEQTEVFVQCISPTSR